MAENNYNSQYSGTQLDKAIKFMNEFEQNVEGSLDDIDEARESALEEINSQQVKSDVELLMSSMTDKSSVSDITPSSHYQSNKYISAGVYGTKGAIMDYTGAYVDRVEIPKTNKTSITLRCNQTSNLLAIAYYNDGDVFVKEIANANTGDVDIEVDVDYSIAKYIYISYINSNPYKVENYIPQALNIRALQTTVDSQSENISNNTSSINKIDAVLYPHIQVVSGKYVNYNVDDDTVVNAANYWAQSLNNNGGEMLTKIRYKASKSSGSNKLVIIDSSEYITNIISIGDASVGVNEVNVNTLLPRHCKICVLGCDMAASASMSQLPDVRRYQNANTAIVGQKLTSSQTIESRYRLSIEFTLSYNELILPTSDDSTTNRLKGKKIVGLGDSAMRGHSLSLSQTWLAKVATRNNASYSNYGKNGFPLAYIDLSTSYTKDGSVVAQLSQIDSDADIILIQGGANDANNYTKVSIGTIDSTDNTTFMGALNYICDYVHTNFPTKKLAFISHYHYADGVIPKYGEFFGYIKQVCEKHSVPVLDMYNCSGINFNNEAQKALRLNDAYHLNEDGMEYVSNRIEQFIRSL